MRTPMRTPTITRSPHTRGSAPRRWLRWPLFLILLGLSGCPNLDGKAADAVDGGLGVDGTSALDAAAAGLSDAATSDVGRGLDAGVQTDAAAAGVPTTRVRIIAANLTSGKKQSWDPGHGQRILQGLVPDIILIQEFNLGNNSAATLAAFVQDMCGDGFSYFREANSALPNGIISRYPILASGAWDDSLSTNREFAWARIDVPGPIDLWAVSVHLLTSKATVRAKQIVELVGYIKQHVPQQDFLIVGGDLNTTSLSEQSLQGFDGLLDRARVPVDQAGNGHTNSNRNKPYDRLFADFDLEPHHTAVAIGAQAFVNGLVFDSRVYTPLINVTPAEQGDSGAESMQHMAIVRDFAIPTP